MDDQELHKLIEQLHAEIQNTRSVDKKGQQLLLQLESEIQVLLERKDVTATPVRPSTLQRMQEGLDHFEATHPQLTNQLSELLEILSNVGI